MRNEIVVPVPYRLDIVIGFHPKSTNCDGCQFCVTDAFNRERKKCIITDEILYFTKEMGMRCPLIPIEVEETT